MNVALAGRGTGVANDQEFQPYTSYRHTVGSFDYAPIAMMSSTLQQVAAGWRATATGVAHAAIVSAPYAAFGPWGMSRVATACVMAAFRVRRPYWYLW
jgi:hypothetical protein